MFSKKDNKDKKDKKNLDQTVQRLEDDQKLKERWIEEKVTKKEDELKRDFKPDADTIWELFCKYHNGIAEEIKKGTPDSILDAKINKKLRDKLIKLVDEVEPERAKILRTLLTNTKVDPNKNPIPRRIPTPYGEIPKEGDIPQKAAPPPRKVGNYGPIPTFKPPKSSEGSSDSEEDNREEEQKKTEPTNWHTNPMHHK